MIKVKNVTPAHGARRYDFGERIYLVEIAKGLWLTLKHLARNLAQGLGLSLTPWPLEKAKKAASSSALDQTDDE